MTAMEVRSIGMNSDILAHPKAFWYKITVHPQWVDYNKHMRDAYYSLVFSLAVDKFQEEIGLGRKYREETSNTVYALEFHNFFVREVKKFDPLDVATLILTSDYKRIHLYQMMYCKDQMVAACESMQLHVTQTGTPAAAELSEELHQALKTRHIDPEIRDGLKYRSRSMGITNKRN